MLLLNLCWQIEESIKSAAVENIAGAIVVSVVLPSACTAMLTLSADKTKWTFSVTVDGKRQRDDEEHFNGHGKIVDECAESVARVLLARHIMQCLLDRSIFYYSKDRPAMAAAEGEECGDEDAREDDE